MACSGLRLHFWSCGWLRHVDGGGGKRQAERRGRGFGEEAGPKIEDVALNCCTLDDLSTVGEGAFLEIARAWTLAAVRVAPVNNSPPRPASIAAAHGVLIGELIRVHYRMSPNYLRSHCTATGARPLPPRNTNDPNHWRERAAQMRALAVTMRDTEVFVLMNDLAADYDTLADRAAARRADGSKSLPKSKPA